MLAQVKITLIRGSSPGEKYTFTTPPRCFIGRAPDCTIQVEPTRDNLDVSRHHCRLDIDPPLVHVRDLDSLNGTFVNDQRIGRARPVPPQWALPTFPADGT